MSALTLLQQGRDRIAEHGLSKSALRDGPKYCAGSAIISTGEDEVGLLRHPDAIEALRLLADAVVATGSKRWPAYDGLNTSDWATVVSYNNLTGTSAEDVVARFEEAMELAA